LISGFTSLLFEILKLSVLTSAVWVTLLATFLFSTFFVLDIVFFLVVLFAVFLGKTFFALATFFATFFVTFLVFFF